MRPRPASQRASSRASTTVFRQHAMEHTSAAMHNPNAPLTTVKSKGFSMSLHAGSLAQKPTRQRLKTNSVAPCPSKARTPRAPRKPHAPSAPPAFSEIIKPPIPPSAGGRGGRGGGGGGGGAGRGAARGAGGET